MGDPQLASAAPATGSLSVRRDLHDGAGYSVIASAPGVTALVVRDPLDGEEACIGLDRAATRRLIEDLELVAGLRPTGARVDLATALAGSARVLFERIRELDKIDPTAADRIASAIAAHLRAWRPLALAEVAP